MSYTKYVHLQHRLSPRRRRNAITSPIGEPNAKNFDTSKVKLTLSTDSIDNELASKLKFCSFDIPFCLGDMSTGSCSGSREMTSSVSGLTLSRILPLLRLSRKFLEVSRLLLFGGICELVLLGLRFALLPVCFSMSEFVDTELLEELSFDLAGWKFEFDTKLVQRLLGEIYIPLVRAS